MKNPIYLVNVFNTRRPLGPHGGRSRSYSALRFHATSENEAIEKAKNYVRRNDTWRTEEEFCALVFEAKFYKA